MDLVYIRGTSARCALFFTGAQKHRGAAFKNLCAGRTADRLQAPGFAPGTACFGTLAEPFSILTRAAFFVHPLVVSRFRSAAGVARP